MNAFDDHVADRVKHMITWRVVAELMRRHKRVRDLIVLELHPAGGQGDTLALYERQPGTAWPGRMLADFRGWRRLGDLRTEAAGLDEGGRYVAAWLRADDPKRVIDAIEAAIGLPPVAGRLPAATPPIIVFRVMAEILGLSVLDRYWLEWRSAFHDSSGGGSAPRSEFLAFPHLAERAGVSVRGDWRPLTRLWLLLGRGRGETVDRGVVAAVDLRGRMWLGAGLSNEVDLVNLAAESRTTTEMNARLWTDAVAKLRDSRISGVREG